MLILLRWTQQDSKEFFQEVINFIHFFICIISQMLLIPDIWAFWTHQVLLTTLIPFLQSLVDFNKQPSDWPTPADGCCAHIQQQTPGSRRYQKLWAGSEAVGVERTEVTGRKNTVDKLWKEIDQTQMCLRTFSVIFSLLPLNRNGRTSTLQCRGLSAACTHTSAVLSRWKWCRAAGC